MLLGLATYLQRPQQHMPAANQCELLERGDVEESAAAYSRIAASGFINLRSRRVTVIPLREGAGGVPG
jgi:hypothetical protein